jgi:barstar (barnase inhibitor)
VKVLADPAKAGVFHLGVDARATASSAAAAGLLVAYVDIGHAHDKAHFAEHVAEALRFPDPPVGWDAFAQGLKDLAWLQAKGWVVILEKSKHFCGGHRHEFEEAMQVMAEAAEYWRADGKPFWTLIGGPEGWSSGWPAIPGG